MALVDNPQEVLYRVVCSIQWDNELNRPAITAFEDKKGLSVSKMGNRAEKDVVEHLMKKLNNVEHIIKISVQQCLDIKVYPINKPSKNDSYHAEIWDTSDKKEIALDKRQEMAKESVIVDLPKEEQK